MQQGPASSVRVGSAAMEPLSHTTLFQDFLRRASYAARAARAVLQDPYEGVERIRERVGEQSERRDRPYEYEAEPNWHERLHTLLRLPWPCEAQAAFQPLWSELVEEMAARH